MLNEQLSAWVDGELDEQASEQVLRTLLAHEDQREACELNWLIGDALRGDLREAPLGDDFTARFMAALAEEPVVLAPQRTKSAARESAFKHWLPMAAALAGVVVTGWMGSSIWSSAGAPAGVVAVASPVSAAASAVVVAEQRLATQRTRSDRAYLLAHQASSAGMPLSDVTQYIRTVSDEQQDAAQ